MPALPWCTWCWAFRRSASPSRTLWRTTAPAACVCAGGVSTRGGRTIMGRRATGGVQVEFDVTPSPEVNLAQANQQGDDVEVRYCRPLGPSL